MFLIHSSLGEKRKSLSVGGKRVFKYPCTSLKESVEKGEEKVARVRERRKTAQAVCILLWRKGRKSTLIVGGGVLFCM